MVRKIALGILLAGIACSASATPPSGDRTCTLEHFWIFTYESCVVNKFNPKVVAAPEIDPASAVAGLTLMIGGLLVFRGRRTKGANA
jgi:hypothetical protein